MGIGRLQPGRWTASGRVPGDGPPYPPPRARDRGDAQQMQATLSPAEILQFHQQGWLPPFEVMSSSSMAQRRPELERIFDHEENAGHNSHQRQLAVWELASHDAIVGRMASLLGDDIAVWRTNFFVKEGVESGSPLQREIPFHQ